MKRILLIIESLCSGGAERQLSGLAVLLKNRGYNVKVLTYVDKNFYKLFLDEHHVEHLYRPSLQNKFLRPLSLVKIYKEYNPDVVISYLTSVNMATCISKIFYHKFKLIVSERNTNQNLRLKDKFRFTLYNFADYVVPNSLSQTVFVESHFPRLKPKVKTITNFVDVGLFTPGLHISNTKELHIVTVARYTPQKNCLRYLEVIKRLKDLNSHVHFDWYGDKKHNPNYFSQITSLVEKYNISDYVSLHNQSNDIISIYRQSDVFCLPSLYEGYPNVVCEAMSCGLPIVCSDVCDNSFIVENEKNGFLFDPLSVSDMVSKIQKILLLSSSDLSKMRKKSRDIALNKFSSDIFVQKYINLF